MPYKYNRYKTREGADKFAERLRKAWPGQTFEIVNEPQGFYWAVGRTTDNGFKIAYVGRPKGPLPGEPGYVEPKVDHWECEYTDTFGGQANYAWVTRETIHMKESASNRAVMIAAKKAVGCGNLRGRWTWRGDDGEFRPYHHCTVLFVRFIDDWSLDRM
jgi:hypothetical protein